MIEGFDNITKEEFADLRDAMPYIAVLIGGADGDFNSKEKQWAEKITEIYSYSEPEPTKSFYSKVADHFKEKIDSCERHLPTNLEERNQILSEKLAKLNDVFPKLEPETAYKIYKEFLHLAKEVAKSSGGFLRLGGIGGRESKWIKLPMIHPVPQPPEEEGQD